MNRPLHCCLVLAALLLSACDDSTLDVDLFADDAGGRYESVVVTIDAIELDRDGSTETIELDQPERIDLMNLSADDPLRLLDGESLSEGDYSSIRLRFYDEEDDDNYLVDEDGDREELIVDGSSPAIPVDFTIAEDEGETIQLALSVDTLLSVVPRNNDAEDYDFEPVLRGVIVDDEAAVSGSVPASVVNGDDCREGRQPGVGVAVYLFDGQQTEPDDFDNGDGINPIAAAPVTGSGDSWSYRLHVLEAGDYTLALTCDADREDPSRNDNVDDDEDFEFLGDPKQIELEAGQDSDEDL